MHGWVGVDGMGGWVRVGYNPAERWSLIYNSLLDVYKADHIPRSARIPTSPTIKYMPLIL